MAISRFVADRIRRAQEATGTGERILPWLSLLLWFVHSGMPFALPYNQSQLNKAWDALAARGFDVHQLDFGIGAQIDQPAS